MLGALFARVVLKRGRGKRPPQIQLRPPPPSLSSLPFPAPLSQKEPPPPPPPSTTHSRLSFLDRPAPPSNAKNMGSTKVKAASADGKALKTKQAAVKAEQKAKVRAVVPLRRLFVCRRLTLSLSTHSLTPRRLDPSLHPRHMTGRQGHGGRQRLGRERQEEGALADRAFGGGEMDKEREKRGRRRGSPPRLLPPPPARRDTRLASRARGRSRARLNKHAPVPRCSPGAIDAAFGRARACFFLSLRFFRRFAAAAARR